MFGATEELRIEWRWPHGQGLRSTPEADTAQDFSQKRFQNLKKSGGHREVLAGWITPYSPNCRWPWRDPHFKLAHYPAP